MMETTPSRCALAVLASLISACTGPEEKLVDRFLEASQKRDLATLAESSMVGFPSPIHSWRVEGVMDQRQEVFLLKALQKKLDKIRRARVGHHRALRQFRKEHQHALAELESLKNGNPNPAVNTEDQGLFSTWLKMEEADRESKSNLDSVRQEVELEREGARKSLNTWTAIDEFDGDVLVRDVLVSVDSGDGKMLSYVLTLKKYTLKHEKNDRRPEARWILMRIQQRESSSE